MKKKFTRVLVLILAVLTMVSASGCWLFDGEVIKKERAPVYTTNLPDSVKASEKVELPSNDGLTAANRLAAIEKVKRSAVLIKMEDDGGVSYGSGVIVDINLKDGDGNTVESDDEFYILTCHHVIAGMGNITVSVPDKNARNLGDDDYDESFVFTGVIDNNEIRSGKEITLVGGDKDSDIAVLKLDLSGNKKVSKEDIVECQVPDGDYTPRQGEEVFAIGNPSGILPMTVSVGVISYIDRAVTVNSVGDMTLLQIDVQTNHGSSGGGLFNCYGELIGITNSGSDEYDGLNYAVPHKNYYVEDSGFITIAKQLIATKTEDNYGYISGKWILGITVKEQKKENGELYLQVESVEVASNADSAGIRKGDIIASVEYDGKKVEITGNASLSSALYEIRKTHGFGKDMKGEFFISVYTKENQEYVLYKRTLAIKKEYIFCDTGVYAEA